MKKIKNIGLIILMVASVSFAIVSIVSLNVNVGSAVSKKASIKSVKNINVKNFNKKRKDMDQIKKDHLEFSDGLSKLYKNDAYFDAEGSVYVYDEEELVSYTLNLNPDEIGDKKMSKSEALSISKGYLALLVENVDDYPLNEISYDEALNVYNVIYSYRMNGFKTTDIVYLTIHCNGDLIGYSNPNMGRFQGVPIQKKEIEKAKETATHNISRKYGETLIKSVVEDVIISCSDHEDFMVFIHTNSCILVDGERTEVMDMEEITLNPYK